MWNDRATVIANAKRWTFSQKCGIFWIPITMDVIYRYVSTRVGGCRGICERARIVTSHFKIDVNNIYPHCCILSYVQCFANLLI